MDRLFLVGRPYPSHRFDSLLPASRLVKLNGFTSGGLESLRSPFTILEARTGSCQRPNGWHRDEQESQANICGDGIKRICPEEQDLIEVKAHLGKR